MSLVARWRHSLRWRMQRRRWMRQAARHRGRGGVCVVCGTRWPCERWLALDGVQWARGRGY